MRDNTTVLGFSKFDKALIILVPMSIAGLIGWFSPVIAEWALTLPLVPMEKLISFIASFNSLWVSVVATVIGIIAGVVLTAIIFDESLEVTVSYQNLQLKLGEKVETIEKKDISAVYIENKQLIILGQNSDELYREVIETKLDSVREALHQYQYPWVDKDPYESQYQRWILGHPDFPEKINVLLYARENALRDDKKKDAKYLREDLAKLGIVIKDERNGQYVRTARGLNHRN